MSSVFHRAHVVLGMGIDKYAPNSHPILNMLRYSRVMQIYW